MPFNTGVPNVLRDEKVFKDGIVNGLSLINPLGADES